MSDDLLIWKLLNSDQLRSKPEMTVSYQFSHERWVQSISGRDRSWVTDLVGLYSSQYNVWVSNQRLYDWFCLLPPKERSAHWGVKWKIGWVGVNILCLSDVTCLHEDCELLQDASTIRYYASWSSTKRTSSSCRQQWLAPSML